MTASVWGPGRVNLIGEHTDYAGGLVLPVAIQLGIELRFEPAEAIELRSEGAAKGWERYVDAVVHELAVLGRPHVGVAGWIEADLPQGAGLGSSGALEVVVGLALCDAAEFELEPLELALACQRAERRAVGVPSGILDQAASLLGQAGSALLLHCASLEHRWVPFPDDVAILVLDSGERHAHEGSGYADRRRELEAGEPRREDQLVGRFLVREQFEGPPPRGRHQVLGLLVREPALHQHVARQVHDHAELAQAARLFLHRRVTGGLAHCSSAIFSSFSRWPRR